MPITPALWSKTTGLTDYNKPFTIAAKGTPLWDWHQMFSMKKATRGQEKWYFTGGFGLPGEVGVLGDIPFVTPRELNDITLSATKYAQGYSLAYETEKDLTQQSLSEFLADKAKQHGSAFSYTMDMSATYIFDQAFVSTNQTVMDGAALAATHTTLISGDTVDNYVSADMSQDTLWDGYNYFQYQILTHNGLIRPSTPKWLVTHPSNRQEVEKWLTASGEPDTVYVSNPNTIKGKGLTPVYNPLLSDTDAWYMIGAEMKPYLIFWTNDEPQAKWEDSFVNMGRMNRMFMRYISGVLTHEFIYCSDGQ